MNRLMKAVTLSLALGSASIAGAQSSDSILSKHIREADGATGQDTNNGAGIKTNHIQNGAVTAAKLAPASVDTAAVADGAITAAKIASPLPASIINRTGLDADSVDGYHAGDFSPIMHNRPERDPGARRLPAPQPQRHRRREGRLRQLHGPRAGVSSTTEGPPPCATRRFSPRGAEAGVSERTPAPDKRSSRVRHSSQRAVRVTPLHGTPRA